MPSSIFHQAFSALSREPVEDGWNELVHALERHGFTLARVDSRHAHRVECRGEAAYLGCPADCDPETRAVLVTAVEALLGRSADDARARNARERMELLSAASFEGIFIHVDGTIIDANARMSELLGFTHAEVLGRRPLEVCVAEEDREAVFERMRSRFEGEYVITGVKKDGTRFRTALQAKQGTLGARPVRVVAFRDVTEQERTQSLLRESEQRLRDLAEQAFDFVVTSRGGVILDARGRTPRVFGYERGELVGRAILDYVVGPEGGPDMARSGTFETVIRAKDGESVPVAVTAVLSSLDGEPVRVSGLRDLRGERRAEAERRRLEQRVERSERLNSLGVLAGGIAHDFNNLLVGVLGNADLLLRRVDDPELRPILENIRTAGRNAADLTREMLVYAGRRQTGPRVPIALGPLLDELHVLLSASLSKGAVVVRHAAPDATVLADRAALMQVIMNLLTNASDALAHGVGTVRVEARRVCTLDERFQDAIGAPVVEGRASDGEWVVLEVRDDGVGMDEATRQRVFEPFFTTKDTGHGLGLASCLGIVSAHGGLVLVESKVGRGSCFSVALPAYDPPSASVHAAPMVTARGGRLLVIDDEPLVRTLFRQALEFEGFEVLEAPSGESGLSVLASTSVDLVILDLTMPVLDGAEVLRRIRASGSEVPVVLASGYAQEAVQSSLEPASYQGFLSKPFTLEELVQVVARARGPAGDRP